MDRSKKEGTLSSQCSVNSEGTNPHDILWLRTKYKFDQIKIDEVKSILVVDESYLTENLRSILEGSNLQVDAAQSGIQALRMIINKHYDIVVMEANLPGLKGGEITQIIKSMSPDTKVIMMTRDEYWDETLRGEVTEVDEVLLKPFAPEELLKVIRRMTERRAGNSELIMSSPPHEFRNSP
jgi:DNA-binding response OmpR family regulator